MPGIEALGKRFSTRVIHVDLGWSKWGRSVDPAFLTE
jgi:hypothetical protein